MSPDQPLRYTAVRARWCARAMAAFLRRWGVYAVVTALLFGAGSSSAFASVGAVAAWSVLPLFSQAGAPLTWLAGVAAHCVLAGALVWGMRPLLWPARWAAAERALPIAPAQRWLADTAVVAVGLLPLGLLYGAGAWVWWQRQPAWLVPLRAPAAAAMAAVLVGSVAVGVLVLQWARRRAAPAVGRRSQVPVAAGPALGRRAGVHAGVHADGPTGSLSAWHLGRPGPLARIGALWLWPLWRGPARRTGATALAGMAVLGAGAGLLAMHPAAAGWWLAALAAAALLLTTRLQALASLEFAPLLSACAVLPLAPQRLRWQRAALVLMPSALGLAASAAALPWPQARPLVALAYALAWGAAHAAEVAWADQVPADKAARWVVSLVVLLALASEVVP